MATQTSKTRTFGVSFPAELLRDIDAYARRESRSRSNAIALLVQAGLAASKPPAAGRAGAQ